MLKLHNSENILMGGVRSRQKLHNNSSFFSVSGDASAVQFYFLVLIGYFLEFVGIWYSGYVVFPYVQAIAVFSTITSGFWRSALYWVLAIFSGHLLHGHAGEQLVVAVIMYEIIRYCLPRMVSTSFAQRVLGMFVLCLWLCVDMVLIPGFIRMPWTIAHIIGIVVLGIVMMPSRHAG